MATLTKTAFLEHLTNTTGIQQMTLLNLLGKKVVEFNEKPTREFVHELRTGEAIKIVRRNTGTTIWESIGGNMVSRVAPDVELPELIQTGLVEIGRHADRSPERHYEESLEQTLARTLHIGCLFTGIIPTEEQLKEVVHLIKQSGFAYEYSKPMKQFDTDRIDVEKTFADWKFLMDNDPMKPHNESNARTWRSECGMLDGKHRFSLRHWNLFRSYHLNGPVSPVATKTAVGPANAALIVDRIWDGLAMAYCGTTNVPISAYGRAIVCHTENTQWTTSTKTAVIDFMNQIASTLQVKFDLFWGGLPFETYRPMLQNLEASCGSQINEFVQKHESMFKD